MKILKIIALVFLSFFLFVSLVVSGLAFTVDRTVLNPKFVTTELNNLDISSLALDAVKEQTGQGQSPSAVEQTLVAVIPKIEPVLKQQVGAAINSVYDYLLGKTPTLDLALILRQTVMSRDTVVTVIEAFDWTSLAKEALAQSLAGQIPAEFSPYVNQALDQTLNTLKPWLTQQISANADPILDYLVGKNPNLNVVIPLDTLKEPLRNNLRAAFLQSPPAELAGVPQAQLAQLFDTFYQQFAGQLPSLVIDQSLLGPDLPAQITEALSSAQATLGEVRQIVSQFQLGYKLVIASLILFTASIVLIYRRVRAASRHLGIVFLIGGIFELIAMLFARNLAAAQIAGNIAEMPAALQSWIPQLLNDILMPLQIFSIAFLVGGIALIVASIVYRAKRTT